MEVESFLLRCSVFYILCLAIANYSTAKSRIVIGPQVQKGNKTLHMLLLCRECPPGFEPFPSCDGYPTMLDEEALTRVLIFQRFVITKCRQRNQTHSPRVRTGNFNEVLSTDSTITLKLVTQSATIKTQREGSSPKSVEGILAISAGVSIAIGILIVYLGYSWRVKRRDYMAVCKKETCTTETGSDYCSTETEKISLEAEDCFHSVPDISHKSNKNQNSFLDESWSYSIEDSVSPSKEKCPSIREEPKLQSGDSCSYSPMLDELNEFWSEDDIVFSFNDSAGNCELSNGYESNEDNGMLDLDYIVCQTKKEFDFEGGILKVDGTSVIITVPKGAIAHGEKQELYAKVYLGRPNDWKLLKSQGDITGLPFVELGPNGAHFAKPIEVKITNPASESAEIDFEFADGNYNRETYWEKASHAGSKEEAQNLAITKEPHVSFFVDQKITYAYYMHFTLGRLLLRKCKKMYLRGTVYVLESSKIQNCLMLAVVLFQATEEGEMIVANTACARQMEEVAVMRKDFKVLNNKASVSVSISNIKGQWELEQGQEKQEVNLEAVFDPEFLGNLTTVDYILNRIQNNRTDFSCSLEVSQNGNPSKIDLKVKISNQWMNNRQSFLSISSGYTSSDECAEHIIDDSGYPNDEENYLLAFFNDLSTYVGAKYGPFARNLKICENDIKRARIDKYPYGCNEICYTILGNWLKGQTYETDLKTEILEKIRSALEKTNFPCKIVLPNVKGRKVEDACDTAEIKIAKETVV